MMSAFELPAVCTAQSCTVDALMDKLQRPDSALAWRLAPLMLDRVLVPDPSWRSEINGPHNVALRALVTTANRVRRLLGLSAPALILGRERRLLMRRVWHLQTVSIVSCADGAGLLDDAPTLAPSVATTEQRDPGRTDVLARTYPWRVKRMVEWLPEVVATSRHEERADWGEVLRIHGYRLTDR